jgi:hypothetical protein
MKIGHSKKGTSVKKGGGNKTTTDLVLTSPFVFMFYSVVVVVVPVFLYSLLGFCIKGYFLFLFL